MFWDCDDCRDNTENEYYMVLDSVWSAAGMDEGLLCIGCLERRLGRELKAEDFSSAPINRFGEKSDRLLDRLNRK